MNIETDPSRDIPSTRVYDLGSNKLRIECRGPHGYFYVSFERGPVPKKLETAFTTFAFAEAAVKGYIAENNRIVKEAKEATRK